MPALEVTDLNQLALLWPATGFDSFGQPVVGAPVEIPVRWLTKRREVLDAKGDKIALDATAVVRQEVPMGSHVWLAPPGTRKGQALNVWYGTGSSGVPNELMEVKTFNLTPDLKARNQRRELGLMRLHDSVSD